MEEGKQHCRELDHFSRFSVFSAMSSYQESYYIGKELNKKVLNNKLLKIKNQSMCIHLNIIKIFDCEKNPQQSKFFRE